MRLLTGGYVLFVGYEDVAVVLDERRRQDFDLCNQPRSRNLGLDFRERDLSTELGTGLKLFSSYQMNISKFAATYSMGLIGLQ